MKPVLAKIDSKYGDIVDYWLLSVFLPEQQDIWEGQTIPLGYAAGVFVDTTEKAEAIAVIPPRQNRKPAGEYDEHLYRERNSIERGISETKTLPQNCYST